MRSLQNVRGELSEDHRGLDSFDIHTKNFYFYPMYINGKYKERQPGGILETFYVTHPISTILGNITSG